MDSPSDKISKIGQISNPNYALGESENSLPFEFMAELNKRAAQLPTPQTVIGPLQTGTWGIVAASPGVGKSMWMALLTKAIAGKYHRAGDWIAPQRRTVLLIDAEMSPIELAGRYEDTEFGDWFGVCSIDLLDRRSQRAFSLGDSLDQAALFKAAEPFEVIIIDNIEYTLEPAPGHNIFAPETWAQVEPITRWAKAKNKLLILVDHLNKEGGVQGSLSKQRGASFVIRLEPTFIEKAELSFKSHFVKLRYLLDEPKLRHDRLWWMQEQDWSCEVCETVRDIVVRMSLADCTIKEICQATGTSTQNIYNIRNRTKHLWSKPD